VGGVTTFPVAVLLPTTTSSRTVLESALGAAEGCACCSGCRADCGRAAAASAVVLGCDDDDIAVAACVLLLPPSSSLLLLSLSSLRRNVSSERGLTACASSCSSMSMWGSGVEGSGSAGLGGTTTMPATTLARLACASATLVGRASKVTLCAESKASR
jgi:hypothetical protein